MKPHAPSDAPLPADPQVWIRRLKLQTTADVEVPRRLIDQVIGQEAAVAVAKKAAEQKRHLLLIGDPGTGKSMIARAMTELLPAERQNDLLAYHNPKNPNEPKVYEVEGSEGRRILDKHQNKARRSVLAYVIIEWVLAFGMVGIGTYFWVAEGQVMVFAIMLFVALLFLYFSGQKRPKSDFLVPKLLLEHAKEAERAPYVDGTGSHAGALLGDVRHDPFQSGGLETPSHVRVEVGAIHRAHKGVLFIDEINVLRLESQQALLTAMQDKQYAIVGQSDRSSGAMVRTEPVPCDFILVAAGNLDAVKPIDPLHSGMHPALRSRLRGYGYEVYVNSLMDDGEENRQKLVQFVAQEVVRDGKIPHFDAAAVAEVIREAQRRAGRSGKLTLRLRELGGLVRTAGDVAREEAAPVVTREHVRAAKGVSRSLEQQITERDVESHLAREARATVGELVGTAKGLAIVGTGEVGEPAALVVPVEAVVAPALSRHGGSLAVGSGLRGGARNSVDNVGALLKVLKGADIADHDVHIDAILQHPGTETEGVGIAVAVAAVSALERVPVRQDTVTMGAVAINGELRAVRSTTQAIEAAARLGYKTALVPAAARDEVLVDDALAKAIRVVYVEGLAEVLEHALVAPAATRRDLAERLRSANALTRAARHVNGNGHREVPTRVAVAKAGPGKG